MDKQAAYELAQWAKTESRKLVETETSWPGSPMETELINLWKGQRPDLLAAMKEFGAIRHLAHVLVEKSGEQEMGMIRQGMPPSDAREQAKADCWMLDSGAATSQPFLAVQTTA
jgi:hypothetical protein